MDRRKFISTTGAAGVAALAGCGSNSGSNTSSDSGSTSESSSTSQSEYQTLEVQHWWTGGDGGRAITALFNDFEDKHPDIPVNQNPVPGGAGQNLHTVIKKRILNNNPPSSWQSEPAAMLKPFIEADVLKDIGDEVWSANGMKDAYRDSIMQMARADAYKVSKLSDASGPLVTVPLDVHRVNNLFYNVDVVEKAGVDPSSIEKPSDLVDAMATVESETDAAGMANQTKSAWSTLQLWTHVLLGEYGPSAFQALVNGKVSENESKIKDSLDIVKQYKQYFNSDAASISWTEANKKIINGNAAFIHQGDWAAGMYRSASDFDYGKQWDQVPFPGSADAYSVDVDSFPLPKHNPSPEATKVFLQYLGSAECQRIFTPKKGAIPPRKDVSKDAFGPFLQQQMKDFENTTHHLGAITHGDSVAAGPKNNLSSAIADFTSTWDVDSTYSKIANAF